MERFIMASAPSKYTAASLKEQFKTFSDAKQHFGLKARSWQALADKLNAPSVDDLKVQLTTLQTQVAKLEAENKQLRAHAATGTGFDEVGFWLLDRNFERAKFEDFGIPEAATEMESQAQAEYKRLAQKYHPDNGGLDEQMQNLNRLRQQMLAIVKLNGGIGL
jgi:polyhydroxyalkanoate synthesis regulator phasin